jgi:3-deoxy-D-manno-octulosonic-acid transferase
LDVLIYNLFLVLLNAGIRYASLFDSKARKWVQGRKNIFEELKKAIPQKEKIIWMHCASLGEFEQGRPLLEKLKKQGTGHKLLLTFFSPSGYEVQKNYPGADWVFYLPLDGPAKAKRFLDIVNPSLVIFVKYEFWYYYLRTIKSRNIPLLLVSALFRKDMTFFKWYGSLHRKMLSFFTHLFVQDEESKKWAEKIGFANSCSVSGDTRFDRVMEIAEKFEPIPAIEKFIGDSKVIVAGSTWKEDEEVLQKAFAAINDPSLKLIIAPHEINESNLGFLKKLFPESVFFSQLAAHLPIAIGTQNAVNNILIIDNIGMLSRLYRYAFVTFIGGGFKKKGVHNVLEAAVYGKPVLFGPFYKKYLEAVEMVKTGGAISVCDTDECIRRMQTLLQNREEYKLRSEKSLQYVGENKGATNKIIQFIQEKRLLTS